MKEAINAKDARAMLDAIEKNIKRVIRGKDHVLRMSIIAMLAGGHLLFEDVPGVGKTTLAQSLSRSVNLSFQRIQGTSDLLPSDILGVTIFDQTKQAFSFRQGPIFANLVLVDEINRTTPKTQSALLEAMNTAQVSIDRTTYDLPHPYMVIATQNPVETHGTFPLPVSQLDRFMMRIHVGYPDGDFERDILREVEGTLDCLQLEHVVSVEDIVRMQAGVRRVKIEESLIDYIVRLIHATRNSPLIELGVSTRGAMALRNGAQAHAYLHGRDFCLPDDVKAMAVAVLAHRLGIVRTFDESVESIGEGSAAVRSLLEETPVPI